MNYHSLQNINSNTYNKGAYNDNGLGQSECSIKAIKAIAKSNKKLLL